MEMVMEKTRWQEIAVPEWDAADHLPFAHGVARGIAEGAYHARIAMFLEDSCRAFGVRAVVDCDQGVARFEMPKGEVPLAAAMCRCFVLAAVAFSRPALEEQSEGCSECRKCGEGLLRAWAGMGSVDIDGCVFAAVN